MVTRLFSEPPEGTKPKTPRFLEKQIHDQEVRPLFFQEKNEPEAASAVVHPDLEQDASAEHSNADADASPGEAGAEEVQAHKDGGEETPQESPVDLAEAQAQSPGDGSQDQNEAERNEQLRQTAEILSRWKEHLIEQARVDLVEVAFMVAEKIIQRELERDPDLIHKMIDEAFSLAAETTRMTLTLHPLDYATWEKSDERAESGGAKSAVDLKVEADPSLKRGDCILHSDLETIDGRLQVRLDALAGAARQALAAAPEKEPP